MIVLLGATGYVGQAFQTALRQRGEPFVALSRTDVDYTRFDTFFPWLTANRPSFLINAAGFTGKPNVDACEKAKADTLQGNTLFPAMLAHACAAADIPWGHVSSGCIYAGAHVQTGEAWRIEKDLTRPDVRALVEESPDRIRGFTETDPPNFSFRDGPCSFYSGTKALAEEALVGIGRSYVWRLRIPFDEFDNARNYLSKVQRYTKVYDNVNSLSHRADFVNACLDLWRLRAPFGTYNVTNPGFVTTAQVVRMIRETLKPSREFVFWRDDAEFYRHAAAAPRSNCVLAVDKLASAGVQLRPVQDALLDSLRNWRATPTGN